MKLYIEGDVIPPSPKNINLNLLKPATASSVYKDSIGYAAERINDGNKLTRTYYWQPKSNKDEWVCIDFERMETVNITKIFKFSNSTVKPSVESYKVQYWYQPSSTWKDAFSNGGTIGDSKTDVFSDIKTSKLRLYILSTINYEPLRIQEFQAFDE